MNLTTKIKQLRMNFAKLLFEQYISGDVTFIVDGEIAEGKEIYVLDAEGVQSAAQDGEYTLDNGDVVTIEGGVIVSLVTEEPVLEEEMSEEIAENIEVTETEDVTEIAEVVDNNAEELAVIQEEVSMLIDIVEELVAENEALKKKFNKFAKQPAGKSAKVEVKNQSKTELKGAARFF